MRVLLVEDNPDDALIIEDMLSATAVEIEHASNLSLALEKLTRGNLDLVLLDLSLPDARGARLRIIVLSADRLICVGKQTCRSTPNRNVK